jgi:hypothetical protein
MMEQYRIALTVIACQAMFIPLEVAYVRITLSMSHCKNK